MVLNAACYILGAAVLGRSFGYHVGGRRRQLLGVLLVV